MTDLNTVIETFPSGARHAEKRVTVPRNSLLMSSGAMSAGITNSGNNPGLRARCQSSRASFYRGGHDRRFIRYENTYRMEPDDQHKIDVAHIRYIATNVIETTITDYKYNANHAKQLSITLAERVRSQLKQLSYPRYKIITQVSIGQKKEQDLLIVSRCIWDWKCDRHITVTKETLDAYITMTIFYIYTE